MRIEIQRILVGHDVDRAAGQSVDHREQVPCSAEDPERWDNACIEARDLEHRAVRDFQCRRSGATRAEHVGPVVANARALAHDAQQGAGVERTGRHLQTGAAVHHDAELQSLAADFDHLRGDKARVASDVHSDVPTVTRERNALGGGQTPASNCDTGSRRNIQVGRRIKCGALDVDRSSAQHAGYKHRRGVGGERVSIAATNPNRTGSRLESCACGDDDGVVALNETRCGIVERAAIGRRVRVVAAEVDVAAIGGDETAIEQRDCSLPWPAAPGAEGKVHTEAAADRNRGVGHRDGAIGDQRQASPCLRRCGVDVG